MITIEKHGILLSPTGNDFENNGVLNPGIYQEGNTVHIFYRAVEDGNFSTIGYAKTEGPLQITERKAEPLIFRDFDYDKHGMEDARITFTSTMARPIRISQWQGSVWRNF